MIAHPLPPHARIGAREDIEPEFEPVVEPVCDFERLVQLMLGRIHPVDHVLRTGSTDPSATEVRNTVLVGHAVCPDVFKLMKVGKLDLRNFPKLLILDTEIIAEPRLGLSQRLKHLLSYYNLPCHDLHNAANDAHFTLKLLLMFAVDNDSTMGWTLEGRAKLLKDIARAPTSRIPRHLAQMEVELLVEGYTGLSTTSR